MVGDGEEEHIQVTSAPSGLTSIISPTSTLSSMTSSLDVNAHRQSEMERNGQMNGAKSNTTGDKNNDAHDHDVTPEQNSKRFSFTTPLTIKCDNRSNKLQLSLEEQPFLDEELSDDESFYTVYSSLHTNNNVFDKLSAEPSPPSNVPSHPVQSQSTGISSDDLLSCHNELEKKELAEGAIQKKVGFYESRDVSKQKLTENEVLNQNHQTQKEPSQQEKLEGKKKKIEKRVSKGTPEGLKPRCINRVKTKIGTPDGLKTRNGQNRISILRAKLRSLERKDKGRKYKKYEDKHRKPELQQQLLQHPNLQQNAPSHLHSPETNTSHVMSIHPPPHLERTAKKSNVSFASSSFMVDQSTTSGMPLFSPPQQRLKVEEAQTAVGLVVAYNASVNKSGIKNLSVDNSSIGLVEESCIGNNNGKSPHFSNKKKYNQYLSLNGITFVPTEESKKKARSKIKEYRQNHDGNILGALPRYGPLDNSHSHVHGQRQSLFHLGDGDSCCKSVGEDHCRSRTSSDNGSTTSLDDWWQYELYKEEKEREEEERLVRQQDWYNYERYKEDLEIHDEKERSNNLNESIDTYPSYQYLFEDRDGRNNNLYSSNIGNGQYSDNIKERESQMWEEEWNNYEQYKEEKEMEMNEKKNNNLNESKDTNASQEYLIAGRNVGHDYYHHHKYYEYEDEQERDGEESQIWKEESDWYKNYEQINDDEKKNNKRTNLILNSSGDVSNSSRQYLFAKRDSESHTNKHNNGYDFSPLTDDPRSKNAYESKAPKPFVVKKGEVSFLSDISHSSAAIIEGDSNVFQSMVTKEYNQQEDSALTGPSYHPKHPKEGFVCEYLIRNQINGAQNDLSFIDLPTIRYEKERMLIQAVRCLKDNLQLVLEVESTFVSTSQYDMLIGTYSEKVSTFDLFMP